MRDVSPTAEPGTARRHHTTPTLLLTQLRTTQDAQDATFLRTHLI